MALAAFWPAAPLANARPVTRLTHRQPIGKFQRLAATTPLSRSSSSIDMNNLHHSEALWRCLGSAIANGHRSNRLAITANDCSRQTMFDRLNQMV
ncbi:hypothetical protein H4R35_001057 [Dimargaris xerosporica]|nr:hypothetical protein H4R35_001057 [Dimargaris xerosporica]